MELLDFGREDCSTAASEDLDVGGATLVEQLAHVGEILNVTALVRRHSNSLSVLLDGAIDDFLHRAVVAEVNHLATGSLDNSSHHIDRGVVSVEEGRGRNNANLVGR